MSFIRFSCRCAAKAREGGFEYFGIQNFGECWSGNGDYSKYGTFDDYNGKCSWGIEKMCDDSDDKVCFGRQNINYVYKLIKRKIQCFRET